MNEHIAIIGICMTGYVTVLIYVEQRISGIEKRISKRNEENSICITTIQTYLKLILKKLKIESEDL
jgi:hypothetical protein